MHLYAERSFQLKWCELSYFHTPVHVALCQNDGPCNTIVLLYFEAYQRRQILNNSCVQLQCYVQYYHVNLVTLMLFNGSNKYGYTGSIPNSYINGTLTRTITIERK